MNEENEQIITLLIFIIYVFILYLFDLLTFKNWFIEYANTKAFPISGYSAISLRFILIFYTDMELYIVSLASINNILISLRKPKSTS